MASLSPPAAASSAASAVPASAAADPLTSASASSGFRSPAGAMAELPRLLLKAATFGYMGAPADSAAATVPSVEAATSNASAATDAMHGAAASATANASRAVGGAADVVVDSVRGFGNVFTYITSKWAVLCLFMTVLLNRTLIYASLRRPIYLPFKVRVVMRIVPIIMFSLQISSILMSMRCQSSSVFRGTRGDDTLATSDGFFYQIGRMGSWWRDDRAVCERIGMIPDQDWIDHAASLDESAEVDKELTRPKGSLELLWPLYKTLSLSQFVEVFSCSLIGRQPASETGMTLLEHSLAFAEAEALASRKTYRLETTAEDDEEDGEEESQPRVMKIQGEKLVPAEVLYISLISALGHVTSHILGIFNRQSKYRLISTGVFGLAFLGGFALALLRGGTFGILDFPTVCVVGFIPHLLIFAAIAVCGGIYGLALLLASLFPPSGRRGFREGFGNLRANLTLSTVNISLSEDFYTTLLKLGFMCLTAASEATYLNEGRAVRVPGWTWLEGERAKILSSQHMAGMLKPSDLVPTGKGTGPYAKERKDGKGIVDGGKKNRRPSGGKWAGAVEMLRGVGVVLARWGIVSAGRVLGNHTHGHNRNSPDHAHAHPAPTPRRASVDSEDEAARAYSAFLAADPLDDEDDESPDFRPSPTPDSLSSDEEEDSDRASAASSSFSPDSTPTTTSRPRNRSASPPNSTALAELFETPARLAAMLDPQSPEDRAATRTLARHLTAPRVLTRGAFERDALGGGREEGVLENILVSKRREKAAAAARERRERGGSGGGGEDDWMADTDEDDDAGSGAAAGPMCVVCQSEPRTIIVWPCRCLSLCEDCRVCLAMNNFATCVCCRRELEGFSRIYIP